TNVPVEFDPEALRYRGATRERAFQIFTELGFRAFAHEYAPTASSIAKNYEVVNDAPGLEALAARLRATHRFAMRIVPDQPSAMRASIAGLAFAFAPRDAVYVPTGHRALGAVSSVPLAQALEALRGIFEDESISKIGHDLKFDAILLERNGVALRGLDLDTMLASYLIDATRTEHRLQDLALELLSYKA